MPTCYCCGRPGYKMPRFGDSGVIHIECWDRHHSDPTGEWPPNHKCKNDPTREVTS